MRLPTLILCALGAILLTSYCEACGKKGAKTPPDNGNNGKGDNNPPANPDATKNMMGDNVKTQPLDNKGFDAKNGQANSPDDLKCDFEGDCCWKNTKPPYDTLDYAKASGSVDSAKMQQNFGTSTGPSGNFIVTSSSKASGPDDKAEFESCVIPCAQDNIQLTFKHWGSQGVKFQACEVAKNDPATLLSCQDVPSSSPGPDTVTLPPGSDISLVIVASNLLQSGGNVAAIDDISVKYTPCTSTTPAPPPATTAPAAATTLGPEPTQAPAADDSAKLCCKFDQGPCGFKKGGGPKSSKGGKTNDFQKVGPERFKNPATGVPPSPDKAWMASYLMPKDNSYMEADTSFPAKRTIKFEEYKATQDISLKACCDTDSGCTYDTGPKTEKGDFRQWYGGQIDCPAGTSKVIFYAENNGVNEGGVGIDNVDVLDENGKSLCT